MLDVDREAPELRALESYFRGLGGALWIAGEGEGEGMVATAPDTGSGWEICRMYVHPASHGSGLGASLLQLAEQHAIGAGAAFLMLWSDSRFARAHRFYEKHGYRRGPEERVLADLADTVEWRFEKSVGSAG